MNNDVIQICGPYPSSFVKEIIGSDPNYVFLNDPDFQAVQVWDKARNSLFVNSFTECEHYVSNGWNYIPAQNSEIVYQNQFGILITITIFVYLFFRRRIKLINEK